MNKKQLRYLFMNLVCSDCGTDFSENSFKILKEEQNVIVVLLKCTNCSKDFGIVFINKKSINKDIAVLPFDIEATPKQITSDEVIDAHNFIKTLDFDWKKHIPNDFIIK